MRRLALAPLVWTSAVLDLERDADPVVDLPLLVRGALEDAAAALGDDLGEARAVGVRVVVRGAVADPTGVRRAAATLADVETWLSTRGAIFFIEKLVIDVHAALDLARLAAQADPVGLIARRILALEGARQVPGVDDPAAWRTALLREARRRVADVDVLPAFAPLSVDEDGMIARETLAARARRPGTPACDEGPADMRLTRIDIASLPGLDGRFSLGAGAGRQRAAGTEHVRQVLGGARHPQPAVARQHGRRRPSAVDGRHRRR